MLWFLDLYQYQNQAKMPEGMEIDEFYVNSLKGKSNRYDIINLNSL